MNMMLMMMCFVLSNKICLFLFQFITLFFEFGLHFTHLGIELLISTLFEFILNLILHVFHLLFIIHYLSMLFLTFISYLFLLFLYLFYLLLDQRTHSILTRWVELISRWSLAIWMLTMRWFLMFMMLLSMSCFFLMRMMLRMSQQILCFLLLLVIGFQPKFVESLL
jgi:hypothetical protein